MIAFENIVHSLHISPDVKDKHGGQHREVCVSQMVEEEARGRQEKSLDHSFSRKEQTGEVGK